MTIATSAPIMTLEEAAAYLRIPAEVLQQQAAIGRIPGREIGGEWRFLKNAIEQWLSTPSPVITAQAVVTASSNNPQIIELLDRWNTADQEAEQTETWNLLKANLP